MACLTNICLETIGLGLRAYNFGFQENSVINAGFGSTYTASSYAYLFNGKVWLLADLVKCGFQNGPTLFNACGTFTWSAQKQGGPVKTLTVGKTWKNCGVNRGFYNLWVTWTPNACAKGVKKTYYGRTLTGVDATQSYPANLWIS